MAINMYQIAKREIPASGNINVLHHYNDATLLDKSGKLIQVIKIDGLDYWTKDDETLELYKLRRNNVFKNFSSNFALYFWQLRRKVDNYSSDFFPSGFAREVNNEYLNNLKNSNLFNNELYIAIITKQPEGLISHRFNLLQHLTLVLDKQAKEEYLKKRFEELNNATQSIINAFSEYGCKLLSTYKKNGGEYSEPLSFLSKILNGEKFPIPVSIDAAPLLMRKRLFFHHRSGNIEIRAADNSKKFAAILSIKGYSPTTKQTILNELISLPIEYTLTQSFRFYDRHHAKSKMKDQKKEMLQSKDESISQTEQIDEVFDETASGEIGYGTHHFSLLCYADSIVALNNSVSRIISNFTDVDIACVKEDAAAECTFWAQLPGNFGFICRPAVISTKNLASLVTLYNSPFGKATNNHWGPAVATLETITGSPYYFNFHYKDVGNFLIFGAMGSGKTALVGFLILQSMKFGGKRIVFDKDRGLEILIRAMGGSYEILKPGQATGMNPCLLEDNLENRKFLFKLLHKMLSSSRCLNERDNEIILNAINGLFRLDPQFRQLSHIASFFGIKEDNSLRTCFDQWHSNGPHAWLFDCPNHSLDLGHDIFGFDLTHLLNDADCKTPALMYLTYVIEQILEGQRGILFCDEGWHALNDDYFKKLIDNWSRTPRKKDNIFGLATQVANDTVNSNISKSINESSFCKVFFPNPSADRKVYMDDFGLTENEFTIIKNLPDDQFYFLLNYGRSTHKESVVLRANLKGMESILSIISSRESSLMMLDQLREQVGDDVKNWLPLFLSKHS